MKGHRFQLAALLLAIVSFGAFGILPAAGAQQVPNAPAKVNVFSVGTTSVVVTWPPATLPATTPVSPAVDGYTLTPTPACGGCTGLTTSGANSTRVNGLTNGTPYTFTVKAHNSIGFSADSPASPSVTPQANGSSCQFDSFPAIPGGSSELAVACSLSTDIGGAGNHYNIEDFPQAQWNTGAGRNVTTTAATAATSSTITAAAGHFGPQDVNDTIAGPGIPSNTFIKAVAVAGTSATLDKAVGSPGVASGAVLTVNNSDGRTFTDALSPATTATGGSTTATAVTTHVTTAVASFPAGGFTLKVTAATIPNFPATGALPATGTLSIATTTPTATDKFTYASTNSGLNEFLTVKHVAGQGTGTKIAVGAAVTLIVNSGTATTLHVASTASLPASGDVTVPTTSATGTALLAYTGGGGGGTVLTGVSLASGTAGTIATAAAVKQATNVTALGGTLNVASTTGFSSPSGTATVATTDPAGATIAYTGTTGTSLTGVTLSSGTGFVSTGGAVSSVTSDIINSATAHFCAPGITPTTCDVSSVQKDDTGRGISGTRIPPGTTIASVISNTQIQLSANTIACPSGVSTCGQLGISALTDLSTARVVQDATFLTSPNRVCSATADFNQTDVNMPIASTAVSTLSTPPRPNKLGANNYITSLSGGCAVIKNAVIAGTNPNVVIGSPDSSAPKNNDAVMSLSSALSVSPTEAPGEPDCSFNTPVGSNLVGKWLNPGSFDTGSLGALPNTGVTGPVIAQLDVTTGTGNPAFAGYAVLADSTNSPGDSNAAPHVDLVFPSLLTGVAVCPAPSTVGVSTVFRFFGETLTQSAAGTGDVRALLTPTNAGTNDNAYEHIITNPSTDVFDASGTCHFENSVPGPGSANFTICHGQ